MSDTKRYEVTFWHTGQDGKAREPGDVVQLGDDEARIRLQDGFIREAPARSAAAKADEKK